MGGILMYIDSPKCRGESPRIYPELTVFETPADFLSEE